MIFGTDGPVRHAILDFVTASSDESSPRFIAPADRVEGTDILSWINANTDPGDLVILPSSALLSAASPNRSTTADAPSSPSPTTLDRVPHSLARR